MKKINKTLSANTLLHIILILLTSISLISCSNDDDTSDTFLKRFDNTEWDFFGDGEEYIKFQNDLRNPIVEWENGGNCYTYFNWSTLKVLELIENSSDTLIVKWGAPGDIAYGTYTFSIEGESIKVSRTGYADGNYGSGSVILVKISNNVIDGLTICN